jgi:predicted dienelactone hydrolase
MKGLMKFALDILPQNPFRHMLNLKMNIRYKAPLIKLEENSAQSKKFVPLIFSHGIGGSRTLFSSLCKDLASQGHIVYALEHKDGSAFTF